jgi:hypothetical protein
MSKRRLSNRDRGEELADDDFQLSVSIGVDNVLYLEYCNWYHLMRVTYLL